MQNTSSKNIRAIIIACGCVLLFAFYLFSREVNRGFLKQGDFDTTVKLQERIDKSSRLRLASFVGNIMEGSTFFASPEFSIISLVVLSILLFKRYKFRVLIVPIALGLLVLGEIYGKSVVHHPSPPFFMIKNPTSLFPKYYINESFSYPSGHAARAVFLSLITWVVVLRRRWIAVVLGSYVVLVCVSRMYLGHHWLSDVIGGALLGGGFGLLTLGIFSPIIDKQ